MEIIGVVAMDSKGGIGKDNSLPWPHCSEDLKMFKQLTKNSLVVMGRNTWYSLPFKLPNRTNVVVSRNLVEGADEVISFDGSIKDTLVNLAIEYNRDKIAVIGGKMLYEALQYTVDTWYITNFNGVYECDTFIDKKSLTNGFSMIQSVLLEDKVKLETYVSYSPATHKW